jgi:uncharacterized protein (UPF0212 family)
MSDDIESRLEALEERVAELETELERHGRDLAMLAVDAGTESVSDQPCPECGVEGLSRQAGLSWSKAVCTECGSEWYL